MDSQTARSSAQEWQRLLVPAPTSISAPSHDGWALAGALLAYAAIAALLGALSYAANDGHLVYTLDDPYIHMAIARNVAEHGVFGVTAYEFSAPSSSPLWSVLLSALYFGLGPLESLPLALNFVFGAAALSAIHGLARDADIHGGWLAALLVACVLLTPLVPVAFTGMEHLLHLLAVVWLVRIFWRLLNESGEITLRTLCLAGLVAAVATATRYESLALIAAMAVALALRKRTAPAALLVVAGAIPVLTFGLFLLAHGQHFLPNSIRLKAGLLDRSSLWVLVDPHSIRRFLDAPYLYTLDVCLLAVFAWRQANARRLDAASILALVVIATTALQIQLGRMGWFYRYEAYLVCLSLVALAIEVRALTARAGLFERLQRSRPAVAALCLALAILALPVVQRAVRAHKHTVPATTNIYGQQYQMGRFIARFYDGEAVAANDIGAVDFLARPRIVDLYGLASEDVLKHQLAGTLTTDVISDLAREHGVRIAVVYPTWFVGPMSLPGGWTAVGTWTIPNNVVCAEDTVTFFATDEKEAATLAANLRAFAPDLPRGVIWKDLLARAPSDG
jgi:hypothetical protein